MFSLHAIVAAITALRALKNAGKIRANGYVAPERR